MTRSILAGEIGAPCPLARSVDQTGDVLGAGLRVGGQTREVPAEHQAANRRQSLLQARRVDSGMRLDGGASFGRERPSSAHRGDSGGGHRLVVTGGLGFGPRPESWGRSLRPIGVTSRTLEPPPDVDCFPVRLYGAGRMCRHRSRRLAAAPARRPPIPYGRLTRS
jgi:hypothetical protein